MRAAERVLGILRADWVRGPALLLYYLGLIYVMIRIYGGAHPPAPPPFVYQGF